MIAEIPKSLALAKARGRLDFELRMQVELITVRKRNNLTTSVTLLDELPVSDLFFPDNEPGIFPIET